MDEMRKCIEEIYCISKFKEGQIETCYYKGCRDELCKSKWDMDEIRKSNKAFDGKW